MHELNEQDLHDVCGSGVFYDLGVFFGHQANISDSIYRNYGNTNRNHW